MLKQKQIAMIETIETETLPGRAIFLSTRNSKFTYVVLQRKVITPLLY